MLTEKHILKILTIFYLFNFTVNSLQIKERFCVYEGGVKFLVVNPLFLIHL